MMKILIQIIVILTTLFFSCNNDNKISEYRFQQANEIDSLAFRYTELNRFSGHILIVENSKILYDEFFGFSNHLTKTPFTHNSSFKIGEVSRLITKSILKDFVDKGLIRFDDHISQFSKNSTQNITIQELINREDNESYNLLGKILETTSNNTFNEIVTSYAEQKGLTNTFYQKKDAKLSKGHQYHNPDGKELRIDNSPVYDLNEEFSSRGIKSNSRDLAKLLKLSNENVKIHGYLENDGFSYSVIFEKETKLCIVVLSNQRQPITNEITNAIQAMINDESYKIPLLRRSVKIDSNSLKKVSGKYALNENVNLDIFVSNDSLFVMMGLNKVYLIPQSSNQFYIEQMDGAMRFESDETGAIRRVYLLNGFIDSNEIAEKIE